LVASNNKHNVSEETSDVAKPDANVKAKAKAMSNVVGIVQKAKAKTAGKVNSKAAAKDQTNQSQSGECY
jgi:hypothetical protein